MMNYCEKLEEILDVSSVIDNLEKAFDDSDFYIKPEDSNLKRLQKIRLFLAKEKDTKIKLTNSSQLDSTDCLTVATTVNLLAYRKGIETRIVRPDMLSRYFHAMLSYQCEKGREIFKVTGRDKIYPSVELSPEQVKTRISYIRPLINLVNKIRGI